MPKAGDLMSSPRKIALHLILAGASITSTKDGPLILGSLGKGNVSRIAPGSTTSVEWIKPGTNGLNQVFGVYADERFNNLWVCSDRTGDAGGEAPAVKAF